MKKTILTTSWDDGHSKNLKLVEVLNKYKLRGTFYVDKKDRDNGYNQSEDEIIEISLTQEIGAHSLTHPDLTKIDLNQIKREIFGSKEWLENLISKPVRVFAYPFGFYNEEIKKTLKEAGFIGARTVKSFNCQFPKDFFAWNPTIHIYPYPFRKRDAKTFHWSFHLLDPLQRNFFGFIKWRLPFTAYSSWFNLARATFDSVCENGGIWHLWGHCFEIEKYNMWQDLEKIFEYVANQKKVLYLTNSQVLEKIYNFDNKE